MVVRTRGDPPPPGALVVREGKRKEYDKVRTELEDDRTERVDDGGWDGRYHLSVFAALLQPDETVEEAVQRVFGEHRRVKFFRTSSPEQLDREGFAMTASPPEPYHYDVVPNDPEEFTVDRF